MLNHLQPPNNTIKLPIIIGISDYNQPGDQVDKKESNETIILPALPAEICDHLIYLVLHHKTP